MTDAVKAMTAHHKYVKQGHPSTNFCLCAAMKMYPLGFPRDFIVQPTTAITDLVVDAFDRMSLLQDGVSLC